MDEGIDLRGVFRWIRQNTQSKRNRDRPDAYSQWHEWDTKCTHTQNLFPGLLDVLTFSSRLQKEITRLLYSKKSCRFFRITSCYLQQCFRQQEHYNVRWSKLRMTYTHCAFRTQQNHVVLRAKQDIHDAKQPCARNSSAKHVLNSKSKNKETILWKWKRPR